MKELARDTSIAVHDLFNKDDVLQTCVTDKIEELQWQIYMNDNIAFISWDRMDFYWQDILNQEQYDEEYGRWEVVDNAR